MDCLFSPSLNHIVGNYMVVFLCTLAWLIFNVCIHIIISKLYFLVDCINFDISKAPLKLQVSAFATGLLMYSICASLAEIVRYGKFSNNC